VNRTQLTAVLLGAGLLALFVFYPRPKPDSGPAADAAARADAAAPLDGSADAEAAALDPVDVKELQLGDAAEDRRSVRVLHPDPAVRARIEQWLEPKEKAAIETKAAMECVADTATKQLVSLRCVSVAAGKPKDGGAHKPVYETLVLSPAPGGPRELTIADVLKPGVGQEQVVEVCQRAADPPRPCVWPPTAFSVVGGESLFVCHDHHCVDLDDETRLVRSDWAAR
jgi:hypothetical protein